jgi:amidase
MVRWRPPFRAEGNAMASEAPLFVGRQHRARAFDARIPPVLEVDPGSVVTFETEDDGWARLAGGASRADVEREVGLNVLAGPVAVRGAEPGDALRLDILDITIARAWAVWMRASSPFGPRGEGNVGIQTPIEGGRVRISSELTVPLEPMIGCIGVAPAEGSGHVVAPAYPFGGNLDLREMTVGTTLYLPVQVPGALFSLGDLHAAQGEAEPTFTGLEAAGTATVRLDVVKGAQMPLRYPRLRMGSIWLLVGLGDTLEAAGRCALDQAYELLTSDWGLDPLTAYAYASARVGLRLGGPASPMMLAVVPERDQ